MMCTSPNIIEGKGFPVRQVVHTMRTKCWSGRALGDHRSKQWGTLGKGRTKWSPENGTIFPGDVREKGTPHGKVRGGTMTAQSQTAQDQCAWGERFQEWVQATLWNHLLPPTGIIPAKPFPPDLCVRALVCALPCPHYAPPKTCTHRRDTRTEGSEKDTHLVTQGQT